MKKWASYFLVSVYLFSFTECRELLKFPILIEHYITHQNENPNMSVFKFIKIHYSDEQVLDADYYLDLKLPFKSISNSSNFISTIPPKPFLWDDSLWIIFSSELAFHQFIYKEPITHSTDKTIFHPPKLI